MRVIQGVIAAAFILFLAACSTSGNLGIVMKSTADPASILRSGQNFEEIGMAKGEACRHFLLAIIPWGASDFQAAVDKALNKTGGDALLNVTVESSLYGFIPIYNVYTYTCTKVKGISVKFL